VFSFNKKTNISHEIIVLYIVTCGGFLFAILINIYNPTGYSSIIVVFLCKKSTVILQAIKEQAWRQKNAVFINGYNIQHQKI
tara:strand:- start:89 stop:334 length:246 start_codon:yes stop_codon:yes gene_type:complete